MVTVSTINLVELLAKYLLCRRLMVYRRPTHPALLHVGKTKTRVLVHRDVPGLETWDM